MTVGMSVHLRSEQDWICLGTQALVLLQTGSYDPSDGNTDQEKRPCSEFESS